MGNTGTSYNIKGVERAFEILDIACRKASPISVMDVCEELHCNSNMAFRLLTSIQNAGYLEKDSDTGYYSVSIKSLQLSANYLKSMELRKLAMPYLELLWMQYQKANVNLAVRNGYDIIMIERIDAQTFPRTFFTPGRMLPFHCTGIGKILVSEFSDEELEQIVAARGLQRYTDQTICNLDDLKKELYQTRMERIGRDRNEFIMNDNCSAAPIYDRNGNMIGAISLSALEPNMTATEIEAAIPHLKETASRISAILGCPNATI